MRKAGFKHFLSDEIVELDTAEKPVTVLNGASWADSNVATVEFKATVGKLLRSYILIMCITFVEQAIGLTVLGVEYSLLIAMAIAVFDILPVVGSGTVMLPWAAISLITGDMKRGVGMLILLIGVTIWEMVRETTVEPDVIVPMTNQHITWTGAGYGG